MNLKINNVNFQGKQEILYGLEKAAKIAKSTELTQKAYTTLKTGITKNEELMAQDASMRAYLDMVTNDSEFFNVINNSLKPEDINPLKNILKEEYTEQGKIEPIRLFNAKIIDVATKNKKSKDVFNAIGVLSYLLR